MRNIVNKPNVGFSMLHFFAWNNPPGLITTSADVEVKPGSVIYPELQLRDLNLAKRFHLYYVITKMGVDHGMANPRSAKPYWFSVSFLPGAPPCRKRG